MSGVLVINSYNEGWAPSPSLRKSAPLFTACGCPKSSKCTPLINIKHLSKYHGDKEGRHTKLEDLRILSGETEYEVDKIMGHWFNWSLNCIEYLVRWKGFSPEHNTFKSEAHLRNAFSQVQSYQSRLRNAKPNCEELMG